MIIKPSADIRNKYPEISKICHETKEPVYLTKNGEGDLVVMDIDAFEEKLNDIKILKSILEYEESVKNGTAKYYTMDEVDKEVKKILSKKVAEESENYKIKSHSSK